MLVIFEDLGQFQTDEIYLEFRLPPFMTMIVGGSVRNAYLLEDLNLEHIPFVIVEISFRNTYFRG
jgi:hypothetical protein